MWSLSTWVLITYSYFPFNTYLRKMAIDGYIVNTDTTPLKKQYEEMHKIGVNINQIAKKVNTTGDLYPEEMKELKEMMKELWHILRSSPLK